MMFTTPQTRTGTPELKPADGPVGVVSFDDMSGQITAHGAFRSVAALQKFIAAEHGDGFVEGLNVRLGDRTISYHAIPAEHLFTGSSRGEKTPLPGTEPIVVFERDVITGAPKAMGAYRSAAQYGDTLGFASEYFGSKDSSAPALQSEPQRFIIPLRDFRA